METPEAVGHGEMKLARRDSIVLVLGLDLPLTLPGSLNIQIKSSSILLNLTPSALNSVFLTTLIALQCEEK